jgi:hypothetical protein
MADGAGSYPYQERKEGRDAWQVHLVCDNGSFVIRSWDGVGSKSEADFELAPAHSGCCGRKPDYPEHRILLGQHAASDAQYDLVYGKQPWRRSCGSHGRDRFLERRPGKEWGDVDVERGHIIAELRRVHGGAGIGSKREMRIGNGGWRRPGKLKLQRDQLYELAQYVTGVGSCEG